MSLDLIHDELGWPHPIEIYSPSGAGAKVFAQLAQAKLGKAISRLPEGDGVKVGVLAADPTVTEAPLAIVCEFPRAVRPQTLLETQRLAWNFSRSLLLITIEPHILRKWSCCEPPSRTPMLDSERDINLLVQDESPSLDRETPEILPRIHIDPQTGQLEVQAVESLHWVELVSGQFFQDHALRFPQDQRADQMLLDNLLGVRRRLRELSLSDTYSHDLLARIIFVQFLFDRKDSTNTAALNEQKLLELHQVGVLSAVYTSFADILNSYVDAYALFQWLNQRFNGDLFPGKGATLEQQEAEWLTEKQFVRPEHLSLLSEFIRGDMEFRSGQRSFWPLYAFDAIPLEFISSVYEEFAHQDAGVGIHYTPGHVVDLMLDHILPWNSERWNLKLLDPACGSGIFLVKAYQRLIYRWKYAHRDTKKEITADVLRHLLEHNIFGLDADANAVRVASFSLYLAMCDEIDPRHYWSDSSLVHFPALRHNRIIYSDFFQEDKPGFRTEEDVGTYDVVIGNPPWGDRSVTPPAEEWAKKHGWWPTANNDIGILFLVKGTVLAKQDGLICMVQSASALLYNQAPTAVNLRKKLFLAHSKIESLINLALFRLFTKASVPTCIITLRNLEPDGQAFWYECPKPHGTSDDLNRIIVEPQDVHLVYPQDVIVEPWTWATLMWGAERDQFLIRKLSRYPNLERLKDAGFVKTREGINRGDRKKKQENIIGRPFFEGARFPAGSFLKLQAESLPRFEDPFIHSKDSTDFEAFELPQLVIKTSWVLDAFRFQAKVVESNSNMGGVICSQSFISVHVTQKQDGLLETCCACYNSDFANYYLLLTSGRFAFKRPEPLVSEILSLPIPKVDPEILEDITTLEEVNERVRKLFSLQEAETILIEDLVNYTLPEYKRPNSSPGRLSTNRHTQTNIEPELQAYCDAFCKVLRAAYGADKFVGAVIYSEQRTSKLPVRMVSFYLNSIDVNSVQIEVSNSTQLRERLSKVYGMMRSSKDKNIFYQRHVRTYETIQVKNQMAIVVSVIKPDQVRHWLRSVALRDADEVAADLMSWAAVSQEITERGHEVVDG